MSRSFTVVEPFPDGRVEACFDGWSGEVRIDGAALGVDVPRELYIMTSFQYAHGDERPCVIVRAKHGIVRTEVHVPVFPEDGEPAAASDGWYDWATRNFGPASDWSTHFPDGPPAYMSGTTWQRRQRGPTRAERVARRVQHITEAVERALIRVARSTAVIARMRRPQRRRWKAAVDTILPADAPVAQAVRYAERASRFEKPCRVRGPGGRAYRFKITRYELSAWVAVERLPEGDETGEAPSKLRDRVAWKWAFDRKKKTAKVTRKGDLEKFGAEAEWMTARVEALLALVDLRMRRSLGIEA